MFVGFVGAEESIEDFVQLFFIHEVVGIVQTDNRGNVFLFDVLCNHVKEHLKGGAGRRLAVFGELGVDPGEDCILRAVYLAVDVDWNNLFGGPGDLLKEFLNRGGLSSAGNTAADGVEDTATGKGRTDGVGKFLNLLVAVLKLFGDVVYVKYLDVFEEGLVPHKQILFHWSVSPYFMQALQSVLPMNRLDTSRCTLETTAPHFSQV